MVRRCTTITETGAVSPDVQCAAMMASYESVDSGNGLPRPMWDTLDRKFTEGRIDALRRLSRVDSELAPPSWTIMRYEVDLDKKIGIGFFSNVYKGIWHDHIIAIKALAVTTPRCLFTHEVAIWTRIPMLSSCSVHRRPLATPHGSSLACTTLTAAW